MAGKMRVVKRLRNLSIATAMGIVAILYSVFTDSVRKQLQPDVDSLVQRSVRYLTRIRTGLQTPIPAGAVLVIVVALGTVIVWVYMTKTSSRQPTDEEESSDEFQQESAKMMAEIVKGIRESIETQKALWTDEKNILTQHREDLAKKAESLEETLAAVAGDSRQLGEALEFLQWACTVNREQATEYARDHLRRGIEAIRGLLLCPPTRRGDPAKFAEAYIVGIEAGPEPKGNWRIAAYRLGLLFHLLAELYSNVESLAEFPFSVFNDHFEHPDLSTDELIDRWDERRHSELVVLQIMDEVFGAAEDDPENETHV